MAGFNVGEQDPTAITLDQIGANHLGFGIIGALDQHIGSQPFDQPERRVLGETDDQINNFERGKNQGASGLVLNRPVCALETPDRGIGVTKYSSKYFRVEAILQ